MAVTALARSATWSSSSAARAAAMAVAVLGLVALAAWATGAATLTSLNASYIPMAPATAVCFAALGGALMGLGRAPGALLSRALCMLATGLCLLLAGQAWLAFASGVDPRLSFERLLAGNAGMFGAVPRGRMSPITAVALVLAAGSLALLGLRRRVRWQGDLAGAAGLAVLWVGCLILLGYAYGAPLLYGGHIIPVALSTAGTLMLLGIALVAQAGPSCWPLRMVAGPSARATLNRAFLPVTAGAVVLTGACGPLIIERFGVHAAVVSAVGAAAALVITTVAVWFVARSVGGTIDRADLVLREAQAVLEDRVRERTLALAEANRELQRTQAGLEQAKSEAERANLAKSQFLSRMSHDLRTPLNAMVGFAQILEIDEPGADRTEPVRQILSGGEYLLALINEVMDITRIETGQLSLSPEPVVVQDVVDSAVNLVRPLAAQRGLTVTVEPFGHNDAVRADRQRLAQVLLNLLSNAVKYNSANGHVLVKGVRTAGDRYRIVVADTGAGIPGSKLSLLFQPFERLGAEASSVEGTGLGLTVSRALAEAMGGSIGVDSVVDRGSTFWIDLAVALPAAAPAAGADLTAACAEVATAARGVLLYVEDNLPNVRLMERLLRHRPNVELRHAHTAAAAIRAVHEQRPDAILLDFHLPDMSGEQLYHRLWEDPLNRAIPMVMVTADATPGLSRRLKAAGATAVLTKPLNLIEVLNLLDRVLRARTAGAVES